MSLTCSGVVPVLVTVSGLVLVVPRTPEKTSSAGSTVSLPAPATAGALTLLTTKTASW